MRISKRIVAVLAVCLGFATTISGFAVAKTPKGNTTKSEVSADSTKKDSVDSKKSYDQVLKKAVTQKGMFWVHRVENNYYFEIPDSLMGRDILIVNKISGVPFELNEAGVNKGMGFGEKCIRFYKDSAYKKVMVMTFDPRVSSPDGDAITRSVRDNYREVATEYFPIETYNKDSSSVVVKVNKVFDGSEKSFNNVYGTLGVGSSVKKELSKIADMKAFPENIVIKSMLSSMHTEQGGSLPLTIDVTSNLVLLAKEPMVARFGDNRVGFFANPHIYFNDGQQKVEERELVNRWRLEPKPEDIEKYKRGELVEPRKPIVFHIDPATPPLWVPYIIKGVEEWQPAFEAAGFKNAIYAVEVDTVRDKDFDIDDIRYSVITYAASERANAMGPSVVDPRSGEIIEADIIWWHNVMRVLHSWIRVQTGAVDSNARANTLPNDLMGNAIRFVSSHELGHSLGMKHNMGASYSVPVDSLRSQTYTANHGTASSIMDYARFNYVAQPEDNVKDLTPQIGKYDKHAINWAYRWLDAHTPHDELTTLDKMLRDVENDIECWYGEQSSEGIDPRSQSEDLGDDAIKASRYGLANLKRMVPHIMDWSFEQGELYFEPGRFIMAIVSQWNMYADHVKSNVGGIYLNNIVKGQSHDRYVPVPVDYQRRSVQYLIDEVFTYPAWLFDAKIWDISYAQRSSPVGQIEYAPLNMLRDLQYRVYYDLLSEDRMIRMFEIEARKGKANAYTPDQMMNEITKSVFEKAGRSPLTIQERMSQKNYVDALIVSSNLTMVKTTKQGAALHDHNHNNCCNLMSGAPEIDLDQLRAPRPEQMQQELNTNRHYSLMMRVSETTSAKRAQMNRILKIVQKRSSSGDQATRSHYQDIELRLKEALRLV